MNFDRLTRKWRVVASLAAAALASASAVQAQSPGVYWSVGLSSPGVQVGVGNAQPVIVQPAPRVVVVPQQPVYVQPQAGYYPGFSPSYYPVYSQPVVVYPPVAQPVYRGGWHHQHHHHGHGYVDGRREEWRTGPREVHRY